MTYRRQRRATLPKLPQLPAPPREGTYAGLVRVPRQRRTVESNRPYPPPPPDYLYSVNEWIVEWYLTRIKEWKKVGRDGDDYSTRVVVPRHTFLRQVGVPALGIFLNTDETRVDFLIPLGAGGGVRSIAIDPYDEKTHPDRNLDLTKRIVLMDQEDIQLIWIYGPHLISGNFQLIDEAIIGIDSSPRNFGS